MEDSKENLIVQRTELKSAVDVSSDKNRNFLIAFLVVMLYMLVAIGSTTDRDILMPESLLELPIVGIKVGLVPFFLLAPSLLLIFHLNLLYNLLEHQRRLFELESLESKISGVTSRYSMHPFLFNFYSKDHSGGIDNIILKVLSSVAIIIGPLFVFISFEIRFSDYQNLSITSCHFVLLLLDVLFIWIFWERIQNRNILLNDCENLKVLLYKTYKTGKVAGICDSRILLAGLALIVTFLGTLHAVDIENNKAEGYIKDIQVILFLYGTWISYSFLRLPPKKLSILIMTLIIATWVYFLFFRKTDRESEWLFVFNTIVFLLPAILIRICSKYFFKNASYVTPAQALPLLVASAVFFGGVIYAILFMVKFGYGQSSRLDGDGLSEIPFLAHENRKSELNLLWSILAGNTNVAKYCESSEWMCPRLKVQDEILFATLESQLVNAMEAINSKNKAKKPTDINDFRIDNFHEKIIAPIDLIGRSLRLADFSRSKIYGAKLRGVDAVGSIWKSALLDFSEFRNSNMNSANFESTSLMSVKIEESDFIGTSFLDATMDGSILKNVHIVGADMRSASLYGSKWKLVNVYGSLLVSAKLDDSVVKGVNIYASDLSRISLRNASMDYVRVMSSNMQEAFLDGSTIKKSELTRSVLLNLDFGTIDLSGLKLSFWWGVPLSRVKSEPEQIRQFFERRRLGYCIRSQFPLNRIKGILAQQKPLEPKSYESTDKEIWPDYTDFCLGRYIQANCPDLHADINKDEHWASQLLVLDRRCEETF